MAGGMGLTQNLFFQVDMDVSGKKSLGNLAKQAKEAEERMQAFAQGTEGATKSLREYVLAAQQAARAQGKLDALNRAGRGSTKKGAVLGARAGDINNINREIEQMAQNKSKIDDFRASLRETGLAMNQTGEIFESKGAGMRNIMGDGPVQDSMSRGELLDRVAEGRRQRTARENFGGNVRSAMERGERSQAAMIAGAEEGLQIMRQQSQGNQKLADSISQRTQSVKNAASGLSRHYNVLNRMNQGLSDGMGVLQQRRRQSDQLANSIRERNGATKDGNRQFGKMFGIGMNLMFMGMALQKIFGKLTKSMLKMTGTSKVFGAAAKSTLLPFFTAIAPLLNKIAFFFMRLPKPMKMVIGAFVALMTVMATFLFFGAQVGIMAASMSSSFAVLAVSIGAVLINVAILSVGLAGLVMLMDETTQAAGAFLVVLALLSQGGFIKFLIRAKDKITPLGEAVNQVTNQLSNLEEIFEPVTNRLRNFGQFIKSVARRAISRLGNAFRGAAERLGDFRKEMGESKGQASALGIILMPLKAAYSGLSRAIGFATGKLKGLNLAKKAAVAATVLYMGILHTAAAAQYAFAVASMVVNGALAVMNALLSPITLTIGAIVLALGLLILQFFLWAHIVKKVLPKGLKKAQKLFKKFKKKLSPIIDKFKDIGKKIKKFVSNLKEKFGELKKKVIKKVKKLMDKVVGFFKNIGKKVKDTVKTIKNKVSDAFSKVVKKLRDLFSKAKNKVGKLVDKVVKFFKNLPGKLKKKAGKLVSTVTGFFKDIKEDGKSFIQDLIDFVTDLPNKITNGLSNLASGVKSVGEDLIQGIIDGIGNMGSKLTNAIAGLMPEKFKKALNKAAEFGGEALDAVTSVLTPNDFILTSGGQMIQPAANDTIVGFNGNGPIQPGAGGGGEVTVNINDPVMKEDVDVQDVVDEVEDRVNRDTRGRTGGL